MSEPRDERARRAHQAAVFPAPHARTPNQRAAWWMLVSGALFTLMGVFVKFGAQHGFGSVELVFYRSAFGLIAIALIAWRFGLPLQTPHPRTHLSRGLIGLLSLFLYFYCLTRLPIATAVRLNYTSPIFLALAIALLQRERVHWPIIACITGGFVGMLLLLRPTLTAEQLWPAACGLASGILAAGA